ncbi:MAG: hypothetical protein RI897_759 [Verrucomicrobiota bacterium]|jgi:hypothetical protein
MLGYAGRLQAKFNRLGGRSFGGVVIQWRGFPGEA